ncbi:MAG: ABC transporter permease [Thermoanaerobaculia bacterium]
MTPSRADELGVNDYGFRASRVAVRLAAVYLAALVLVALIAPLLANDEPLAMHTRSGWVLPFLRNRLAADALVRSAGAGAMVVHAPVPFSPNSIDLTRRLEPPSKSHLLGTDELGRDVLSRMIHGSRVSVTVGVCATAIALLVGILLGSLAGYYGGGVDWIISRLIEIVLCFPLLVLVLAIVALMRPSVLTIVIALGITGWPNEARFIRGEFLKVREMEFAQAARATGAGDVRIMFRHILPNALAPVVVSASFGVASAILVESALSFLGFGVPLPMPSWGSILSAANQFVGHAWWLALFPGVAIFLTVAACHLIGDRFREALDPTLRGI